MKNLRKKRNLEKASNTLKARNLRDILSGIIVCGRIESKKTLGKEMHSMKILMPILMRLKTNRSRN
jgi:hypothetical protein